MSVQPDDSISFLQLFMKSDQSVAENQFEVSLLQAIGNPIIKKDEDAATSKLNKVMTVLGDHLEQPFFFVQACIL